MSKRKLKSIDKWESVSKLTKEKKRTKMEKKLIQSLVVPESYFRHKSVQDWVLQTEHERASF